MSSKKDSVSQKAPAPFHDPYILEEVHVYGVDTKNFTVFLNDVAVGYADTDNLQEPGIEYQMANQFIKNLHVLSSIDSVRPILVEMNTSGGDEDQGFAIYDAIHTCPNPVRILGVAPVTSMATLILQAAGERILMPDSYFMFHEGTRNLGDTPKASRAWLKLRDERKRRILDIYISRIKEKGKFRRWTVSQIRDMLQAKMDKKEDVILSAVEAVEWGFADRVLCTKADRPQLCNFNTKKK